MQHFTMKCDELKNLKVELLKEIKDLKSRADDSKQRSRNSCLLIHGIEEQPNEDTNELRITLQNDDYST